MNKGQREKGRDAAAQGRSAEGLTVEGSAEGRRRRRTGAPRAVRGGVEEAGGPATERQEAPRAAWGGGPATERQEATELGTAREMCSVAGWIRWRWAVRGGRIFVAG